tara:strand:+ start:6380 stop:6703 length:324 start_codon:yes stop_codon:yes gene_type:complete
MHTKYLIKQIGEKLISLLSKKNDDYGDSATQGESIFATEANMKKMSPKQFGLCCRLDDKIYRIKNNGLDEKTIDSLWDIAGYIILLLTTYEHEDKYKNSVKKELDKI